MTRARLAFVLIIAGFSVARKEIPRFPAIPHGSNASALLSVDPRYAQSVLHVESSLLSPNLSNLAAEACPVSTCEIFPLNVALGCDLTRVLSFRSVRKLCELLLRRLQMRRLTIGSP